jgi:hypothetical protein
VIVRRPLILLAVGCIAVTVLGLLFGQGRAVALAAALTLAAALAVAAALELRPAPKRRAQPPAREDALPSGLRQVADILKDSERSAFSVDRSLRPLLVPIVTARLGRRGVDMGLAPGRAQELLGDPLWEIVRPDRPSVASRAGGGIDADDLRDAIERLEQL